MSRRFLFLVCSIMLSGGITLSAYAEPAVAKVRKVSAVIPSVPACSTVEPGCYETINHFVKQTLDYIEVCTLSYDIIFHCHQHFLAMDQQLERQQRDAGGEGPLFDGKVLNYIRIVRQNLDAVYLARDQSRNSKKP